METLGNYSDKAIELIMAYAPKLVLAIITLFIGLWIIKVTVNVTRKTLEKSKTDATLIPFITSIISWALKLLLFISVASMIGIATTSFIAVLGAAGLAIGLALQGSLANFAGGFLIIIFRPYNVGDLVEAQGHLGVVKEVQIFNTILLTPDNKRVIIPNGTMSNGSITNYSAEGRLRVDLVIGIAYDADISKAKSLLAGILKEDSRVLETPAPTIAVSELADSSVNLVVRPWCNAGDYWSVYFDTTEKAKKVLEGNGISIPFPQQDIHISNAKA